jgi:cytochrome c peroxidase
MPRTWPLCVCVVLLVAACSGPPRPWEAENPVRPLPDGPLGTEIDLAALPDPPTPEQVRLGRWLFYDTRLSADHSVSCATCHRPEHAFSEPAPASTGIGGQVGTRKAPTFVNQAQTLYPHFFWDGRAASLEEQVLGPIENPIEMGNTHEGMVETLVGIQGYRRYFGEAFGSVAITADRVARAIAAYERTRMSGNSAWDRWRQLRDEDAVSAEVKQGHELFFGKAGCNQCHLGPNFTDSRFHNVGIGWDEQTAAFADEGRYLVTGKEADRGAFKTPTLREVTRRAPYMHDGSVPTLRAVIELYDRGGTANPLLAPQIEPLGLTGDEIDALLAFLAALEGEGYQDTPPTQFPR